MTRTPQWKTPGQAVIRTVSGRYVDLLDPDPSTICIEDIAYHLDNLCRFTGACVPFYSVARHSVLVSKLCPPEAALCGLLHDASEAYLGDISSPLKHSGMMDAYLRLELQMEQAIAKALGHHWPVWMLLMVKEADEEAFGLEWAAMMQEDPAVFAMAELQAKAGSETFMERYAQLLKREEVH